MTNKIISIILYSIVFLLISSVAVFSVLYLNYEKQIKTEEYNIERVSELSVYHFASSHALLQDIETNLTARVMNDRNILHNFLMSLTSYNEKSNIVLININKPTDNTNTSFFVFASTDETMINKSSMEYNHESFFSGHTYYIVDENQPILTIISPINISGKNVGTKEIVISMENSDVAHDEAFMSMIFTGVICVIILFTIFFLTIRKIIIKSQKK